MTERQTVTRSSPGAPARPRLVLTALILAAAVANLPLAVANVALPSIGVHFDASQTELNLVAVSYSLGLALSVLWFGALGDRYGRRQMLLLGICLSVPACLVAAWAPNIPVLIGARIFGGLAAGMAYPTTLSLITALWSGEARTRPIALWSAIGGALAALGPLTAGLLLEHFWWGSVFLVSLPLVAAAVPLVLKYVPSHVHEGTEQVDNLGGLLSALLVGALVLGINVAPVPGSGPLVASLLVLAVVVLLGFVLRERRAPNPLYDLHVAGRRVFWVAASAGMVVFGSLMATMFVGQQYLQNVLGYDTVEAGVAILPAAVVMVLIAPRSAKLVAARGARFTLLVGYACILGGFLTMLLLWGEGSHYPVVGLGYALVGAGVGFAGTPASHSLTGSVPVTRVGMASGTADLQRDLGGAVMQSVLGALLTAGYASAAATAVAGSPQSGQVSDSVQSELTKSYDGAQAIAQQYPPYANQIIAAAKKSFIDGQDWAYLAGVVAILLGGALVWFLFPRKESEDQLLAEYHREDAHVIDLTEPASPAAPRPAPGVSRTTPPP